jgi:hypothetical protein
MNTSSADTTRTPQPGSGRTRAPRARSTKVAVTAILVLLGTFAGLVAGKALPASASTLNGVATIADPDGLAPLASGASTDEFTVALPANASCDGDTATQGYHVFSYLQPEGTNPVGVLFTTGFPSSYYGLVTSTERYYGAANTAISTGQIIGIPNNLEFAPLLSKGVSLDTLLYADGNTDGVWEAGIACANSSGVVTDYWNTEVTFTASGTDPNGFVWSDTPGPCTTNATVAFTSAAGVTFNQRAANAFTASASGCPDPTITQTTGTLPSGVTYSSTGLLTGNPTQSGSFPITLSAAIGAGTPVTQSFTLTVPVISPYAPTIGTATGGNAQATVNFSGPSNNGGSSITSYKVTATDATNSSGTKSTTGSASPITITGLANGDSYTFTVAATNSVGTGPASGASNAVVPATVPDAPVIGTATGGNTQASVAFSPPDTNGGSAISSYTVTASDSTTPANGGQTQSGSASPIVVTGLTNGDSYTFTVTATNGVATGPPSDASNAVVPAFTVPGPPTAVTPTAGKGSVKLTWKAPSNTGGSAITGYVIRPSSGSAVTVGKVTSYTVTKLTNGTAYTFTVAAKNAIGTGPASARSKSVTPNGLYIATKSLPKATKGAKYAAVTLVEKNGVGTETWSATGLPAGLTLSSKGVLAGKVSSADAAKTYTVSVTVKDSSKPTKQTATKKLGLVVAS